MDMARWWNTQGVLRKLGVAVFQRGFPLTHYLAQARVVFAVARSRCNELFNPPKNMTLWNLLAEAEDLFGDNAKSSSDWQEDYHSPICKAFIRRSGLN
jgi:hypothetical protein